MRLTSICVFFLFINLSDFSLVDRFISQVPEHVRVDASALVQLLSEFTQKVNALRSFVQELTQRIVDGELQTSKGISLLEVKSHLLLQYCVNLGCLLLQKLDGQSIAGHAVVKQLIVLRTCRCYSCRRRSSRQRGISWRQIRART